MGNKLVTALKGLPKEMKKKVSMTCSDQAILPVHIARVELQLYLLPDKSGIEERIRILSSVPGPSINSELKS